MPEYCFYPGICQEFPGNLLGNLLLNEFAGKFARRICREFAVNLPAGICLGELATGNLPVEFARGGCWRIFQWICKGMWICYRNLLVICWGICQEIHQWICHGNLPKGICWGNSLLYLWCITWEFARQFVMEICSGNWPRNFSEILAGNLLVNSLGPLVLITAYYCLLVLIWHDRDLPAFYVFLPAKPVLCIPPFCPPWLSGASSAK